MSTASAAAVRTAAGRRPVDLERRLRGLLTRSSRGAVEGLAERLLPTHLGPPAARRLPPQEGFYWLRVSSWLADSLRLTATTEGRALLAELHWIQFCVYGLFRAQDDLVDGDSDDARLAVEANHLLVEAARCAARHFASGSPFWILFRDSIDASSRAIVDLDRLQRTPHRPPHAELRLYEELAACLKIAAGGVCIAAGRQGDWRRRISPALDRLAVAAQIFDDLQDVGDDLAAGRINYVAWYLSRPVFAAGPQAMEAVVASSLATSDRPDRLLTTARRLLGEAADLLPPTLCPRTHAFLRDYERGLAELGEQMRRGRRALLVESEPVAARPYRSASPGSG